MVRLPDWEDRLHAYLDRLAGAAFVWGKHDCALFAAGAVQAITDRDPAATFRGRYTTARGSVRALRRWGAGDLEKTVAAMFPDRASAFARRGDLVLVGDMVGVCVGADALLVGEEDGEPGLVRAPRATWSRCWSVG
jgi:hypothetical protein